MAQDVTNIDRCVASKCKDITTKIGICNSFWQGIIMNRKMQFRINFRKISGKKKFSVVYSEHFGFSKVFWVLSIGVRTNRSIMILTLFLSYSVCSFSFTFVILDNSFFWFSNLNHSQPLNFACVRLLHPFDWKLFVYQIKLNKFVLMYKYTSLWLTTFPISIFSFFSQTMFMNEKIK